VGQLSGCDGNSDRHSWFILNEDIADRASSISIDSESVEGTTIKWMAGICHFDTVRRRWVVEGGIKVIDRLIILAMNG